jgi:hypothetical protein
MIAGLTRQAETEGASLVTLRALVEEASEAGAARALARVGLGGEDAGRDVGELRALLAAWREAKQSARAAVIGWAVKIALTGLVVGVLLMTRTRGLLD